MRHKMTLLLVLFIIFFILFNGIVSSGAVLPQAYYGQGLSFNKTPRYDSFKVTAYDLGFESCGKTQKHPAYGIAYSGFSLVGMYWKTDKYVAVDPDVIPLGVYIEIIFQDEYHSKYSGIYKTVDTGGAIKGNRIDLFIGDFKQKESAKETIDFGVAEALVRIL